VLKKAKMNKIKKEKLSYGFEIENNKHKFRGVNDKEECETTYSTHHSKHRCIKDKLCTWDDHYNDGLGKCLAVSFKG